MVLRDHLGQCEEIPDDLKKKFFDLKSRTTTGATYSKSYWNTGALPPGIVETPQGLAVDERFVTAAQLPAHREEAATGNVQEPYKPNGNVPCHEEEHHQS